MLSFEAHTGLRPAFVQPQGVTHFEGERGKADRCCQVVAFWKAAYCVHSRLQVLLGRGLSVNRVQPV